MRTSFDPSSQGIYQSSVQRGIKEVYSLDFKECHLAIPFYDFILKGV